ncbi:hypothetical protein [Aeromicrobium sp. UC242_57]
MARRSAARAGRPTRSRSPIGSGSFSVKVTIRKPGYVTRTVTTKSVRVKR